MSQNQVIQEIKITDKTFKTVLDKTVAFESEKGRHYSLMRAQDGSLIVGGDDKKLTKYNKDLQLVAQVDLGLSISCGILVNNKIVCGISDDNILKVFDINSLKFIREVHVKDGPTKLFHFDDQSHILSGGDAGNLSLVNVKSWSVA